MTKPEPPTRPTVSAPGVELPERPIVADASITYVTVVNPDRRRHVLQAWERDLLFTIGNAAQDGIGVQGVSIMRTAEAFEQAGLIELSPSQGEITRRARLTDAGKTAAAKGWYET